MEELFLEIEFPDQETKWQFMDLMNSEKGIDFLIKNGVQVSSCATCEKGEPCLPEDYGDKGYMEFQL